MWTKYYMKQTPFLNDFMTPHSGLLLFFVSRFPSKFEMKIVLALVFTFKFILYSVLIVIFSVVLKD